MPHINCEYYGRGDCDHMGERCILEGGKNITGCALVHTVTNCNCASCLSAGAPDAVFHFGDDGALICGMCGERWESMEELCGALAELVVELRKDRDAVARQRDEARGMVPPPAEVGSAEVVRQ